MCVGDWRLGRLIKTEVTTKGAAVSPDTLAERNFDRVGLTICAPAADAAFGFTVESGSAFRTVAILTPDNSYFHITLADHGDLCTKKFRALFNTNATVITVIEYFLPDRVLQDIINRYYSPYKQ